MGEAVSFRDQLPVEGTWFLARGADGYTYTRHTNTIHRRADKEGLFTPGNFHTVVQLTHWLPLPEDAPDGHDYRYFIMAVPGHGMRLCRIGGEAGTVW